jgi:hypothetical protein
MTLVPFNLKRGTEGDNPVFLLLLPGEFGSWSYLEREPKGCFSILNLEGQKGNLLGRKIS